MAGVVTDGWQISGITTANTGAPLGFGFGTTNGLDITGSTNEARASISPATRTRTLRRTLRCPTAAWRSTRRHSRNRKWERSECGRRSRYHLWSGFLNFDASLSRSIPIGSDRRQLKLRLEAFNVFNHTEFSGVNTTFTYDATGKNTVSSTGQYTSDRGPRIMSLELRFQF